MLSCSSLLSATPSPWRTPTWLPMELGEREGGREGEREGGREGEREGGREERVMDRVRE